MIRTRNPEIINGIVNHPDVAPWMPGTGPFDLTEAVRDPLNFCFLTEEGDGAYVLKNMGAGRYEAHTMALVSARGQPMSDLSVSGFEYLFTRTDCHEITT